jgi:hypothetical protein
MEGVDLKWIGVAACVIAAAWLAVNHIPHWGWFLIVAVLVAA